MNLLKDLLSEEAAAGATSAAAVAGVREPLRSEDGPKKKKKKKKKMKTSLLSRMVTNEGMEDEMTFDPADVMSKLKASEKAEDVTRDTVSFGLEDEDGQVIKVFVRAEQADDFEKALGQALEDMENSTTEIAEILFDLREKFDIVNVEWPPVQEDEEENVELAGGNEGEGESPEGEGKGEGEGEGEGEGMAAAKDEADAKSALQSVIDMMKSDADARKAEAEAKKAEAEAEASKYAAQAAEIKIKGDEEVLDMETYNAEKAKKEKEARTLAALAKYRHELAQEAKEKLSGPITAAPEEEEVDLTDGGDEMSPEEYLAYVNTHLKSQG